MPPTDIHDQNGNVIANINYTSTTGYSYPPITAMQIPNWSNSAYTGNYSGVSYTSGYYNSYGSQPIDSNTDVFYEQLLKSEEVSSKYLVGEIVEFPGGWVRVITDEVGYFNQGLWLRKIRGHRLIPGVDIDIPTPEPPEPIPHSLLLDDGTLRSDIARHILENTQMQEIQQEEEALDFLYA